MTTGTSRSLRILSPRKPRASPKPPTTSRLPTLPSEVKRAYERLAWALGNLPRTLARLGLAKAG